MNFYRALIFSSAILLATVAAAQEPATTAAPEATATASAAPSSNPAVTQTDSRQTRDELRQLLERHPREVGIVLKLDPTLFRNEQWMATYPELKAFVANHPDVPQNADYYLESVWVPDQLTPETPQSRMTRDTLQGIFVFAIMILIFGSLIWLIRTLLDHRRWSRAARVQAEIHNKLLDRFTSHDDLLRYVENSAGKEFITAASSPVMNEPSPIGRPMSRILWSLQAGIVLVVLGIGLQIIAMRAHPEASGSFFSFGILLICAGIGFALSGGVAWAVARKLNVIPPPPDETGTENPRTLNAS
ncbi:MAG: hypothetical protein ACYC7A_21510 [Thermoanaerobaculia bacterium]